MKRSDITFQKLLKILDLAISEGFLTNNAAKDGSITVKAIYFQKKILLFLKALKRKT